MNWTDPQIVAGLEAVGTNVCRVATAGDWWIERLGSSAIISHENDLPAALLPRIEAWAIEAGIAPLRIYSRRLVVGPGRDDAPQLVVGDASPGHKEVVSESGLHYEVDFLAGYSCGLFLDQRANRSRLRSLRPRRVLNTFSYTCSFSVAAASAGARTLSLDLAKSALERGRRNFLLNNLPLENHRFIADDVLQVLPRLARRGEKFDAIILDPPTFSRGSKGRPFQVEKDFRHLLSLSLACAHPHASLLLSTNCSSLDADRLLALAADTVPSAHFHQEPSLPDIPPLHASATLWMSLP